MYIKINNLFDDSTCILLQWLVGETIVFSWVRIKPVYLEKE